MRVQSEVVARSQLDARALVPKREGGRRPYIADVGTSFSPFHIFQDTMAIARPIRMLGAACILLCLFLVFQLRQDNPSATSKLVHGMSRDPLLDRALPLPQY